MNKQSVIFIEPIGNRSNVFDNYMKLPLVGPLYLGTILHNNGYNVKILNENILGKKLDPYDLKADIFCLTALTVSANRTKVLAGQIKKLYPNSKILIGGIHASLIPDEFTSLADHVIVGEAESIIIDIVEGKYTEKIIKGDKCNDLDNLPLINYSILDGFDSIDIVPVMTSRGCPFDCNFCTVTKIFGKKFRMQSPERILAEIKNAMSYSKYKEFFFYDDNFSANKERVNELCDLILKEDIKITWFAQVRTDLAKNPNLIKKMVKSGLRWVQIGFESINDQTLEAYHKSQTKKDIENAIKILHYHGVNIHGMFMFGDDNDNALNIRKTVRFAIKNNIDTVQFMILTPFPGTQIYEKLEMQNRIFHKNWDYFNAMFVVFETKQINPVKLTLETFRAYKKFYSIKRTILEIIFLCVNIFFNAFSWNFKNSKKYGLDTMFIRLAAKIIIQKNRNIPDEYIDYIEKIEKEFYI